MRTSSADGRPARHLSVEDLSAGYGSLPVVFGIDVQVGSREVVSIIGANGAGKSTLLKAIIGQAEVMGGRVLVGTDDVTGVPGHQLARRGIGFVPQINDVFPTLTVVENLEMGGYLLPRSQVRPRIDEVLDVYPALARFRTRTASKLSGGERKMLAIARVLMVEPNLLILDEPTSGLSAPLAHDVLSNHVRALAKRGAAVLLVEQKAAEALAAADWAYVLAAGAVQGSGPAADLLERDDIGALLLGRGA